MLEDDTQENLKSVINPLVTFYDKTKQNMHLAKKAKLEGVKNKDVLIIHRIIKEKGSLSKDKISSSRIDIMLPDPNVHLLIKKPIGPDGSNLFTFDKSSYYR